MSIEAMKQALEALENFGQGKSDVANNLRQAIAEAEKQEPVSWGELLKEADQIVRSKFVWKRFIDGTPLSNDVPVWMADFAQKYTHPPKREWVGLTDEEVNAFVWNMPYEPGQAEIRAIEAKLKEKNT